MTGLTYRYLEHEHLYPFGYGLSYARFEYSNLRLSQAELRTDEALAVTAVVRNVGEYASDEVVQLYVTDLEARCRVPHCDLRGFRRIHLKPGEERSVSFSLAPRDLSLINEAGERVLEPGRFRVTVGGSQPDARSATLMQQRPIAAEFEVTGVAVKLPY